jgi:3-isopropylmalate dehydrogenase
MPARPSSRKRLVSALPEWSDHTPDSTNRVIGVLAGEGIGPEIIPVALDILDVVAQASGQTFEIRKGGKIGVPAVAESGRALTPEVIEFCSSIFAENGALLCGPGGGRFVYDLRAEFDLYCKFTPIRPAEALRNAGALKPEVVDDADLVVVRENISGLYFGESMQGSGAERTAHHTFGYTESHIRRILVAALRLAELRDGRLCVVLKPGGVPVISALWKQIFLEVAEDSEVRWEILEVDNAIYQIIADPGRFDVVVAPNTFGDIISDGASLLLGSRGMSFSGNFGMAGRAVFQTGHGAAHDLAGTGRANPLGQILSLAMLLRESFGELGSARAIENAVEFTLAEGWRTEDIAEPGCHVVGTIEMGQCVRRNLERLLVPEPASP